MLESFWDYFRIIWGLFGDHFGILFDQFDIFLGTGFYNYVFFRARFHVTRCTDFELESRRPGLLRLVFRFKILQKQSFYRNRVHGSGIGFRCCSEAFGAVFSIVRPRDKLGS